MAGKQRYHHGNLKQVLLASAVQLISEVGPQAFTLREVARRAGVSHNAPYRHFRDREDLLWAVAAQGFDLLTASMQEAMSEGSTAAERLRLAGRGYVQFALSWPQHVQVMFDLPPLKVPPGNASAAGQRAFQTLLDAVVAVQGEGGFPAGDPLPLAVVAWSGVHGLAKLAISGRLPFNTKQTVQFTRYLTLALSSGIASLPHPSSS
jgi:AcrR family transcriptional regulator